MTAAANPPGAIRVAARGLVALSAAAIALVLLWRILDRGVSVMDETTASPKTKISAAASAPDGSQQRARLAANPADYMALLGIALQAEREGDRKRALDAASEAFRLAPADPRILANVGALLLRAGNEEPALRILRQLAELHPNEGAKVWPVMIRAMDSGRYGEFFATAARDDPSWWASFFGEACQKAALPGLQSAFAGRVSAGRITDNERRCLIGRLQREAKWPAAYQVWLNSLPKDQQQRVGFIFNGEFEYPLSNLGFDWLNANQDGVAITTETTEGTNGRRALHLTFVNKRFTGSPLQEYLLLSPGRYRFEGRGRPEGLNSWLGVQWGLYCHDANSSGTRQLAASDSFLGSSDWTDFHQDFVVSRDCPVQVLRLELANPRRDAKSGGSVAIRLRGSVWFDDLKVKILD